MAKRTFTWSVFTHWMNLAYLLGVAVLGVTMGTSWLVAGMVLEVAILWVAPDLPPVQRSFEAKGRIERIEKERWYYLKSLWKYDAPAKGFLISRPYTWHEYSYRNGGPDGDTLLRLCQIVQGLRELQVAKPEAVADDLLIRMDEMINAWLALVSVEDTANTNIKQINTQSLSKELERLRQAAASADPQDKATKVVLGERLQSIKARVDSLPKLERRKTLARAQADSLASRIEALNAQVRTSGAVDAGSLMDTSALLDGDLFSSMPDEMEIAAEIRGITSGPESDVDNKELWAELEAKLPGKVATPAKVASSAKSRRFLVGTDIAISDD